MTAYADPGHRCSCGADWDPRSGDWRSDPVTGAREWECDRCWEARDDMPGEPGTT